VTSSNTIVWIVLGSLAGLCLCVALGVGLVLLLKSSGSTSPSPLANLLGGGGAVLDPNNVENTRAWAAEAVSRLKEAEASKNEAKTSAELVRVEKELKDGLLGKQVRWTFPVEAVDEGEVKLETFFGTSAGEFRGDDPKLKGRPLRRLYLRVYFDAEKDGVKVGDEVTPQEASRLRKGSFQTVTRTVIEATVTKKQDQWVSTSAYSDVVDVLEPFCVTIVLARR
jgi:hypothetical protein